MQALSRGCERATFVELDPWVTQRCLQPNIESCELRGGASVVTTVRPRQPRPPSEVDCVSRSCWIPQPQIQSCWAVLAGPPLV